MQAQRKKQLQKMQKNRRRQSGQQLRRRQRQQPESYVLYARLVQSRFTLVKYITHFTVKQLTFALKRPLLSIVSNILIDYFDALFRFC